MDFPSYLALKTREQENHWIKKYLFSKYVGYLAILLFAVLTAVIYWEFLELIMPYCLSFILIVFLKLVVCWFSFFEFLKLIFPV